MTGNNQAPPPFCVCSSLFRTFSLSLRCPPKGNLILIRKNLTWIQALSYCRKHHHDLVHISDQGVQWQVAEAARSATSAHVWIGLRYSCDFNFWFWTSSTSACYLNWAPGQGSHRRYECGATGAVEATRGQQWVGLPDTEALNFICAACAGWAQQAAGVQRHRWIESCLLTKWSLSLVFLTLQHADTSETATAEVLTRAHMWHHPQSFVRIQLLASIVAAEFH